MADRERERDPRSMSDLLGQLVVGRGWNERMALGRLRGAWTEVVGPVIGARSEPASLQRGLLTVRAEAGAWASELTMLAPEVATKADAYLGGGLVREVRVVAGRRAPRPAGEAPTSTG